MAHPNHHRLQPLPPKFLVLGLQRLRNGLRLLHNHLFPSQLVVYEIFQNLYLLPPLYVVTELDIASKIHAGDHHIDILANKCQVQSEGLYRVMRALTGIGIFRERGNKQFFLTQRGNVLLDDRPGSLRNMLRHHLSPTNWRMLGELLDTLKTGEDGFTRNFNKSSYAYLKEHPDQYGVFDLSMAELTAMGMPAILKAFSFKRFKTIADIGGGDGTFLAHILIRNPDARGTLLDVPEALIKSKALIKSWGLDDRMTLIEGDFLKEIPEGFGLYLLKNILHNWPDNEAIDILKNIAQVMPADGRILIIDMIIQEGNSLSTAKLIDIQMLSTMPGGKERTWHEFEVLCHQAGLQIVKTHTTISPIVMMEVKHLINE